MTASAGPVDALTDLLARRAPPLVAFDIFDTLVERKVHPEKVKVLACERLRKRLALAGMTAAALYDLRRTAERRLCERNEAAHGELEFSIDQLGPAMYRALADAGGDAPAGIDCTSFACALTEAELAAERQVLSPVEGTPALLALAASKASRVILVSDFYLPQPLLRHLLEPFGLLDHVHGIYVSCDWMATKRSGRLYDAVLRDLGMKAADLLMIGDNEHSDIAMAQDRGGSALHLDAAARRQFYASPAADVENAAQAETALHGIVARYHGGEVAAASLLLFIERLHAHAVRERWRDLFFLAREGQLLKEMFDIHQDALGVGEQDRIRSHYLLASRRSCYVASLAPLEEEDFAGLFNLYRRQSLRSFCANLRLEPEAVKEIAKALDADPDAREDDFPTSDLFARLRSCRPFKAHYERQRLAQRDNLRDYIAQFGVAFDEQPLVLVDVGWKGSIQDFVARAVPCPVEGCYVGLLSVGQSMEHKRGLLFSNWPQLSATYHVFNENRSLYEILLCADHASALGYRRTRDGRVVVDLDEDEDEAAFIEAHAMPAARAAMALYRELVDFRHRYVVEDGLWEEMVADIHADLVFRPSRETSRWIADASHRENFGVFTTSTLKRTDKLSLRERAGFFMRMARDRHRTLGAEFWPALTLQTYGGTPAAWLYERYRRKRLIIRRRQRAPARGVQH